MNEKRLKELCQRFQSKSSEELTAIWIENDRTQWADETFAAIERILTERSEPIPEQGAARDHRKNRPGAGREAVCDAMAGCCCAWGCLLPL